MVLHNIGISFSFLVFFPRFLFFFFGSFVNRGRFTAKMANGGILAPIEIRFTRVNEKSGFFLIVNQEIFYFEQS